MNVEYRGYTGLQHKVNRHTVRTVKVPEHCSIDLLYDAVFFFAVQWHVVIT